MTTAVFECKTALVTGAGSGIGAATARLLRAEGAARLVLIDRDRSALDRVADELALDAKDLILSAQDVTNAEAWLGLEAQVHDRFGNIDHLVAAAGIGHSVAPIADLSIDEWRRTLAVNLDGSFLALKTGIRLIRASGQGGGIVLLSSSTAFRAQPGMSGYAVSKSALVQLARTAAAEVAADNIRVNVIAPGVVETPLFRNLPWFNDLAAQSGGEAEAFRVFAKRAVPLGRATTAEETAMQILFLLGPAGATITGAVLNADGGMALSAV